MQLSKGFCIVILAILIFGFLFMVFPVGRELQEKQEQLQDLKQEVSAMREELDKVQSDVLAVKNGNEAVIRKLAKEKGGLVEPGETVCVPDSKADPEQEKRSASQKDR